MADGTEPIVVAVTDQVAPSIKTNILGIADAATKAQTSVDKLQKSIASVSTSSLDKLATAVAKVNAAIDKNVLAYLKQETALNQAIAAEARARTATLALETAEAKSAATALKAATANKALADSHIAVYSAIQKQKAAQDAINAQQDINALLGVGRSSKSASQSASVFSELFAAEDAAKALAAKKAISDVGHEIEQLGFKTARSRTELIVLAHEMAQGNTRRFGQSLMVLAEQTGVASLAFTAVGATILGVAAVLGIVGYAVASGSKQFAELNRELTITNNYAGLTADSYITMANVIAQQTNTTVGSNRELITSMVAMGTANQKNIHDWVASAQIMSRFTGQATEDIIKDFEKAEQAPTKYAFTLNNQFHFMSVAQLEHIKLLEDTGRKEQAVNELSHNLYTYLGNQVPAQLGYLEKAWIGVKNAIGGAWQAMKDWGRDQTLEEKIASVKQKMANLDDLPADMKANKDSAAAVLQKQLDALLETQRLLGKQTANESAAAELNKEQQAALETAQAYHKYFNDVTDANSALKKFHATIESLPVGDPERVNLETHQAQIEAAIRLQYASKSGRKSENEAATRAAEIRKVTDELQKESLALGLVSDAREREMKLDQLDASLDGKHKKLSPNERATLGAQIDESQAAARVNAAAQSIDAVANGPTRDFNDQQQAAFLLLSKGTLTAEQFAQAMNLAGLSLKRAKDPLYDLNKGLEDQDKLLQYSGPELEVQTRLQQAQNEAEAKGKPLTDAQTASYKARFEQQQKDAQMQSALNQLYADGKGKEEALQVQQEALNKAYTKGYITADQYANKLRDIRAAEANLRLAAGNGDFSDVVTSNLSKMTEGYTNVLDGLKTQFGDFFVTLEDGFANSIGQAVVHAKSLKEGLHDVAQQGIAALISGLVKLGIQYVINAALGQTIQETSLTAATTASVAAAEITAVAWAEAAAMVSLASYGANAAPAMAGITATSQLSEGLALSSLAGFEKGGYTGDFGRKEIAGVVHGKEFVVNSEATERNRGILEAMNNGATAVSVNSDSRALGSGAMRVEIHNHGTHKNFDVKQLSEGQIRIIARDEADKSVRTNAPEVVAAQIDNPNSRVSKSLVRSTSTQRRR